MGAIKQSNAIYLSIADGKISRRFASATEESVQRTTKEGKIVHEEFYKAWDGLITDIHFKDHPEYGKFLNVTIRDNDQEAILQMKFSSGYAMAFLKTLPNADLSSRVIIAPNMKMEGDKKKTSLFITQHGKALKWAFTRENPNGLPELVKAKFKGVVQYDDTDILEFLEKMVNEEIIPKLKTIAAAKPNPPAAKTTSTQTTAKVSAKTQNAPPPLQEVEVEDESGHIPDSEEVEDDLPF